MNSFIQFLVVPRVGLWRCLRFVGLLLLILVLTLPAFAYLMTWTYPAINTLPAWGRYIAASVYAVVGVAGLLIYVGTAILFFWHTFVGIPLAAIREGTIPKGHRAGAHNHPTDSSREED